MKIYRLSHVPYRNVYHATHKEYINNILANGLITNSGHKNYAISNDNEICLAGTPESAGFWFNGDPESIVILEINIDMIDLSAFRDDPSGAAYLYTENIPPQAIKIIKTPDSVISKLKERQSHYVEREKEYRKKFEHLKIPDVDWNIITKY